MLIAIAGAAGGPQSDLAMLLTERLPGTPLVFRYDNVHWAGPCLDQAPFAALAGLAQRWANPRARAPALSIPDLECLRVGGAYLRGLDPSDFTAETLALAKAAAGGHALPDVVVIDSLSRLYEQALARVLAAATSGLGDAARAHPTALVHAADAMSRLCWDLAQAKTTVIATLWETETWRSGKQVGVAPMAPKSALNQIDLWLRAQTDVVAVVERSTWPGLAPGTEIAIAATDWTWLDAFRRAA